QYRYHDKIEKILKVADFLLATFFRTKRRFKQTGDIVLRKPVKTGRPPSVLTQNAHFLVSLTQRSPCLFLDEYQDRLERFRELPLRIRTGAENFEIFFEVSLVSKTSITSMSLACV
ncbi:hypothetical protein DL96DRAFT_1462123, partial [Flagelloscypha sp. PMI_526]